MPRACPKARRCEGAHGRSVCRLPCVSEPKGGRTIGVVRPHGSHVLPLARAYLDPQAHDLTSVLYVLAVGEMKTGDHNCNGRVIEDVDVLSVTAQRHLRPSLDRLVRRGDVHGDGPARARGGQGANRPEDQRPNRESHHGIASHDEGCGTAGSWLPPPNGSRLSCGRNRRWRKEVQAQRKRLAGEVT